MPNYFTLRANLKTFDGGFIVTPSGSAVSALQDSLDSSFIRKPASNSYYEILFDVQDPSPAQPATGTYLVGVTAAARLAQGSGGSTNLFLGSGASALSSTVSGTVALPLMQAQVSTASRAATGIITVTTVAAHGLTVNDLILVQGTMTGTPTGFINASYRVLTVGTATTFTAQDIRGAQVASTANAGAGNISFAANANTGAPETALSLVGKCTGTAVQDFVKAVYIGIGDQSTSASRATIYESYIEVQTAALPTIAINAIDGDSTAPYVVTTTSRPNITWTTTQVDGFLQSLYRVKIFTSATATPDTTTTGLVYDSLVKKGTNDSLIVPSDLLTGTTYFAYVKAATVNTIFILDDGWSSWASLTFSTSFTPPTAPTCSVAYSTSLQRVRATLAGASLSAAYTSQTFDLQRSDNGGTTWYFVRGAIGLTPDGSFQVIKDDFEMKRGITAQYRARSVGVTTANQTVASAWGTVATVVIPTSTEWAMRSLNTTGELAIVKNVKVLSDLGVDQSESLGIFKPLGRSTTLVVHGDLTGEDGTYGITCSSQATFDELIAVINSQSLILVSDPFNEQKYIHVTSRSWTKVGAATSPRYELELNYVATESGLTAG